MVDFLKVTEFTSSDTVWHTIIVTNSEVSDWLNNQNPSLFSKGHQVMRHMHVYDVEQKLYVFLNVKFDGGSAEDL